MPSNPGPTPKFAILGHQEVLDLQFTAQGTGTSNPTGEVWDNFMLGRVKTQACPVAVLF